MSTAAPPASIPAPRVRKKVFACIFFTSKAIIPEKALFLRQKMWYNLFVEVIL